MDVTLVDADELVDDEVVVDVAVVGGTLVVVVVVGARVELVLDVDAVVTVVESRVLLVEMDVVVEAGGCVVRVVLVVVVRVVRVVLVEAAVGTLVEVVLVTRSGVEQAVGAGAFRAAKRRGRSFFTDAPPNSRQ